MSKNILQVWRLWAFGVTAALWLGGCHGFAGIGINSKKVVGQPSTSGSALMATWSNGQAIKEYQDFLATGKQEIEMKPDGPSIIVTGDTKIMTPLVRAMVNLGGGEDVVIPMATLDLPESLAGRTEYPIYIAVPPPNLAEFLENLPDDWMARRADMVFFSGGPHCGCIEPVLKKFGYARDTMSQVLVGGFTMPENDMGKPRDISCKIGLDSMGLDKWAGECGACGKWAGAFHERLYKYDIRCRTGFYREWRRWMWERALFDGAFNLVGGVREEPVNLAEVAMYYDNEVSDMAWQFSQQLRGWLAVTITYGFEERMFGFAEREGNTQVAKLCTKEMYPFVFGSAPFENSQKIVEYLNYAQQDRGLLEGAPVPESSTFDGQRPSKMRQGNLRSDGVM